MNKVQSEFDKFLTSENQRIKKIGFHPIHVIRNRKDSKIKLLGHLLTTSSQFKIKTIEPIAVVNQSQKIINAISILYVNTVENEGNLAQRKSKILIEEYWSAKTTGWDYNFPYVLCQIQFTNSNEHKENEFKNKLKHVKRSFVTRIMKEQIRATINQEPFPRHHKEIQTLLIQPI